jgi:hypothetical protein
LGLLPFSFHPTPQAEHVLPASSRILLKRKHRQ